MSMIQMIHAQMKAYLMNMMLMENTNITKTMENTNITKTKMKMKTKTMKMKTKTKMKPKTMKMMIIACHLHLLLPPRLVILWTYPICIGVFDVVTGSVHSSHFIPHSLFNSP